VAPKISTRGLSLDTDGQPNMTCPGSRFASRPSQLRMQR
jgi:hypothetical protein